MPSRVTFLGASIINFNSSIGWGTQTSQLSVNLVEDASNGDVFAPPAVGQPVYFAYEGFSFGGILQSWRKRDDQSSHPTYEVTVTDPREILDGVQLILGGYTGGVSAVPNLVNIYGYWEGIGFGNAEANDTGIPWERITDGYVNLQTAGGRISFRGYDYLIDFNTILTLPLSSSYRVGGEYISLIEFIDDVCNASGHDYYITLYYSAPFHVITVHTINRNIIPVFGAVQAFIDATDGVTSKEVGRELRNETNAKFLTGGQKEDLYLQYFTLGLGDGYPYDNDIWPFWGTDINGNAIIGSGIDGSHAFTINTSSLRNATIGTSYFTDTREMRAALLGEDVWQRFLISQDNTLGVHYHKATDLGIGGTFGDFDAVVAGVPGTELSRKKLAEFVRFLAVDIDRLRIDNPKFRRNNQFYEWLSNYASSYYGKQFMVRTPFISMDYESGTGRIVSDYEPVDTGFVDSSLWATAIASHILPSGLHKFTDQQDKIYPYVRFTDTVPSGLYDVSELSEDSYVLYDGYLFVKAQVDERFIFVNKSTLSDPRVVVTLPGRVKPKDSINNSKGAFLTFWNALKTAVPAPSDDDLDDLLSRAGADNFFIAQEGLSYRPDMAAVPTRSNIETYGPWYATSADGKVEYEKDDSLVPWNYGGYTYMNLVGQATVNTNISYEQANEGGTIVVPGGPTNNIGSQLIVQSGFPYITDISVSCGSDGVSTTYSLQQWTPRFGTTSKQQIERFKKHSLNLQRIRRANRFKWGQNRKTVAPSTFDKIRNSQLSFVAERKSSTSHPLIMGEVVPVVGTSGVGFLKNYFSEVAIMPYVNAGTALGHNYTRKGMGSLDSLFRPFNVASGGYIDPDISGVIMPHFETPTGGSPDVDDLNPFSEPHDMSMFIQGDTVPSGGLAIGYTGVANDSEYRLVGLRSPLILVGWGYGTDGLPVPNSGDGEFVQNHRQRQDLWKAGPLDARWDDERKVWEAGGSLKVVKLLDVLHPGSETSGLLMTGLTYTTEGTQVTLSDPLFSSFGLAGEKFAAYSANSRYEPAAENGLFRRCTLLGLLTSKGSTSGILDDIANATIWDDILVPGQLVYAGGEGYAQYERGDHKWYLTQVSCSGT